MENPMGVPIGIQYYSRKEHADEFRSDGNR